MNFQPKFDSGRSLDANFLPLAPKHEPELSPKAPNELEVRSLILRLSLVGFIYGARVARHRSDHPADRA